MDLSELCLRPTAFRDGYLARLVLPCEPRPLDVIMCPYDLGSTAHFDWISGWREAQKDLHISTRLYL